MSAQTPASSLAADSTPGDHRWYYRNGGRVTGPIVTEQLLQDARGGRLTPQAEVRLGTDGEWVRASLLEGLFPPAAADVSCRRSAAAPGESAPSSQLSRLVAECRVYLHQRDIERLRSIPAGRLPADRPVARRVRSILSGAVSWVTAPVGLLGSLAEHLSEAAARSRRPVVAGRVVRSRWLWGVAFTGVLVSAGVVVHESVTRRQRQAENLAELAAELRTLRAQSADDEAWNEFEQKVRRRLEELIPALEDAARADDRASIDLLWAARDYLPQMLLDARKAPSDAERQFEVCLRRVRPRPRP